MNKNALKSIIRSIMEESFTEEMARTIDPNSKAGKIRSYYEQNPSSSVKEIADALGIDRNSVAVAISKLKKETPVKQIKDEPKIEETPIVEEPTIESPKKKGKPKLAFGKKEANFNDKLRKKKEELDKQNRGYFADKDFNKFISDYWDEIFYPILNDQFNDTYKSIIDNAIWYAKKLTTKDVLEYSGIRFGKNYEYPEFDSKGAEKVIDYINNNLDLLLFSEDLYDSGYDYPEGSIIAFDLWDAGVDISVILNDYFSGDKDINNEEFFDYFKDKYPNFVRKFMVEDTEFDEETRTNKNVRSFYQFNLGVAFILTPDDVIEALKW